MTGSVSILRMSHEIAHCPKLRFAQAHRSVSTVVQSMPKGRSYNDHGS
jgi:hypothetical protein